MSSRLALASLFLSLVSGQQIGTLTAEVHPSMTWQTCTASGCTNVPGKVVLDSNWRWLHSTTGSTNCYTGNTWDKTLCPDDKTCAANCALDGADYTGTYGATASGNSLKLGFVTGKNVGSRLFMLKDDNTYQLFQLLNKEFTFDVDVSHLPCGLNGALYLVSMAADGGQSIYPGNKAGPKYGVGYCDAQCPSDLKFINGEANVDGWTGSSNSANSGAGKYGSCCAEMDIWEANSMSTAFTPHSSTPYGQTRCSGDACGGTYSTDRYSGVTDPDGCDFNSYRQGNTSFYGPGKIIDTNKVFTVVTQFLTNDGTDSGTLSEIKRFYVQGGVTYANSQSNIAGVTGNSITQDYCTAQKSVFGDDNGWVKKGGFSSMSDALKTGMVLSLSLWDDYSVSMLWLDSTYPTTGDPDSLGYARGSCSQSSGKPADIEVSAASAYVIYSNIKVGTIGSTFKAPAGGSSPPVGTVTTKPATSVPATTLKTSSTSKAAVTTTTSKAAATTSAAPPSGGAAHWGQCGGIGWAGPKTCVAPYTCKASGDYYSQCL